MPTHAIVSNTEEWMGYLAEGFSLQCLIVKHEKIVFMNIILSSIMPKLITSSDVN